MVVSQHVAETMLKKAMGLQLFMRLINFWDSAKNTDVDSRTHAKELAIRLVYIFLFRKILCINVTRSGGMVKKNVQLKHKKRKVLVLIVGGGLKLIDEDLTSIDFCYIKRT